MLKREEKHALYTRCAKERKRLQNRRKTDETARNAGKTALAGWTLFGGRINTVYRTLNRNGRTAKRVEHCIYPRSVVPG